MAAVYHIVAKHSVAKVATFGCTPPQIMDEKEFTVTKKIVTPVTVVDVLHDLGLSYEDILIGKLDTNILELSLEVLFPPQATVQFQKLCQASSAMTVGYRLTIHVEKVEAVE
jgi:hypothetical protein